MRLKILLLASAVLMPGPIGDLLAQENRPAPPMPAATGDVLTFDALIELVGERNRSLRAVRASADAAATRVSEASALPDPVLQLGIMNFGIPDFATDMPNSMAPAVQFMQMVPFPGKLGLRGDIAEASRGMADAGAEEAWWSVRDRAATLFYELYSLDRRLEVMSETLGLLRDFQTIAKAMYSAGTGRQADVLRADVEVARMDGEIRKMEAMRTVMAARLNATVDLPATSRVATPVLPALPNAIPSHDTLRTWAAESRPLLAGARLGVRQADSRIDLARKQIWPDLTLGLTYGQRDLGTETRHMGSAMIGFSLPIHASSRQLALREEAGAMKRMAEAELGGLEAEVDARIGEELAEVERARSLVRLYRDEVLPEARATVESALSSYRVGSVDFMTLVDAQMTVNRYEGEFYELLADYGKAVAGIESAIGRTLPPTHDNLADGLERQ